jgi:hypothetical protein
MKLIPKKGLAEQANKKKVQLDKLAKRNAFHASIQAMIDDQSTLKEIAVPDGLFDDPQLEMKRYERHFDIQE